VVVLLLAVAVQSKANDKIISDITSLDYKVQRDLMFFIETTLAQVKSHAIMAGTFTSGKKYRPSLSYEMSTCNECSGEGFTSLPYPLSHSLHFTLLLPYSPPIYSEHSISREHNCTRMCNTS
jgi:hypothetical protein